MNVTKEIATSILDLGPTAKDRQQSTLAKAGATFICMGEPDQHLPSVIFPLTIDPESQQLRAALDPETTALPITIFEAPHQWAFVGTAPACNQCTASGASPWTRLWVGANPKFSAEKSDSKRWLSRCEEHASTFWNSLNAKKSDIYSHEESVRALKSIPGHMKTRSFASGPSLETKLLLPRPVPTGQGSVDEFLLEDMNYRLPAAKAPADIIVSAAGAEEEFQQTSWLEVLAEARRLLESGVAVGLSFPVTERDWRFVVDIGINPNPTLVAYDAGSRSTGNEANK